MYEGSELRLTSESRRECTAEDPGMRNVSLETWKNIQGANRDYRRVQEQLLRS
jgi:hypothetical protein